MSSITLDTPLANINGIGPRFVTKLAHLKIKTVAELLRHFPTRYEDFSQIYKITDLEPGQEATIQGTVEDINVRRSFRRNMTIIEAVIAEDTGTIRAVWFNQPYVENALRPGRIANFAGKVTISDGELTFSHPTYELLNRSGPFDGLRAGMRQETKHTARLVPIYPETRGLTSKGIRFIVQPLLKSLDPQDEWIPEDILDTYDFPETNDALRAIHFPDTIEHAEQAKKRFAFEDLFLLQLVHLQAKLTLGRERAPMIRADIAEVRRMIGELPFSLTLTQKRSLWEIIQDIAKPHPMHRLLQGDVGSGKTVVVSLAAVLAAAEGYQTAFMAPTEVLARQHYHTMKKLFASIIPAHQPAVGLLTSAQAKVFYENDVEAELKKTECAKKVASGEIAIVIGTHALLEKSVLFKKLGLTIVDEQHRFGVRQRAILSKGRGATKPHLLSMSATPIPRTLTLALFGDLDISAITELPTGRRPIVTKVIAPADRAKAYVFIRSEVRKGRQAFVICPRIDPADTAEPRPFGARPFSPTQEKLWEVKSVKEEYEKLSQKIFPDLRVAMLHGQMPASSHTRRGLASAGGGKPSKEAVMHAFQNHEIDILVSTSVIEVGVDIPNATVMMIEGSDRFGLAQLYQFRGRVGRGAHQSYCFLFTDATSKTTFARLHAVRDAKNGFELAEIDLALRGPGEFLGSRQTGIPDTAMRGLTDAVLVKSSRDAATSILQKDPLLFRHHALRQKLFEFKKRIHPE